MPDLEDETSATAQGMASRAEQLSERPSAGKPSNAVDYKTSPRSSPSHVFTAHDHCVRGWWRDTLCNTSKDFNAQAPSFSSHLDSLRNAQRRVHCLARKCTQARLYPNPASANSKSVLKAQFSTLVADMDFAIRLHDMYSAALNMCTFPVQAVIDSLNVSGKECHCPDCTRQFERWTTDTYTEIQLEAKGLMNKLLDMSETFKKLKNDLLGKWEKDGKNGILRRKAAVKKYFPRQISEIEEAANRTVRKSTFVGRVGSKDEAKGDEKKYDSGCETKSKVDFWYKTELK